MKNTNEIDSLVIGFRAPAKLAAAAKEAAALSRSDTGLKKFPEQRRKLCAMARPLKMQYGCNATNAF
jgi:hypothetical protein